MASTHILRSLHALPDLGFSLWPRGRVYGLRLVDGAAPAPRGPANTRPVPTAGVNAVHCPSALAKSLMMSKLCEFWGPKAILDVAFVGASPFLPGYP